MRYVLAFGAPVRYGDHQVGSVQRILVNNGVCNQFSVNPSGLFSGHERVVPISDVIEATEEGITLDITDVEWKAYGAFDFDHLVVSDHAAAPDLLMPSPSTEVTVEMAQQPTTESEDTVRAISQNSVVLTRKTRVGDNQHLRGLVIDTGIPTHLLVEGDETVPIDAVARLDNNHIWQGQTQPRPDSATPPGGMGGQPPHVQ